MRSLGWTVGDDGRHRLTPEGLYGRRKMTALVRRSLPDASRGAVDRAMCSLGLPGVVRAKGVRTTIPRKDGKRAGDLLNRNFTAAAPNRTWVTDFTHVRCWAGFVYVAFVLNVDAQRIVAWNAATTKQTDLVMTPLRIAIWQRDRQGHPITPGKLIGHADAGSQGGFNGTSLGTTRRGGRPSSAALSAKHSTRGRTREATAVQRPATASASATISRVSVNPSSRAATRPSPSRKMVVGMVRAPMPENRPASSLTGSKRDK